MSVWGQVSVAERLVLGLASRRFLPGPGPHLSVRWRKPFALGTAPSKLYRIPKKPWMPEDQAVELKRLTTNYNTQMKSIRAWMVSELAAQELALQSSVEGATGEEAEHQRCMKINQKWNDQVAKEREVRLAKEREVKMEQILLELQQEGAQKTQRTAEIKQLIAAEKEMSSEYITEANIDDAIEQALATEVDHNYAIDRNGTYLHGYETKVETPNPEPSKS